MFPKNFIEIIPEDMNFYFFDFNSIGQFLDFLPCHKKVMKSASTR